MVEEKIIDQNDRWTVYKIHDFGHYVVEWYNGDRYFEVTDKDERITIVDFDIWLDSFPFSSDEKTWLKLRWG